MSPQPVDGTGPASQHSIGWSNLVSPFRHPRPLRGIVCAGCPGRLWRLRTAARPVAVVTGCCSYCFAVAAFACGSCRFCCCGLLLFLLLLGCEHSLLDGSVTLPRCDGRSCNRCCSCSSALCSCNKKAVGRNGVTSLLSDTQTTQAPAGPGGT
jgi:hypothetical protein